MSIFSFKYFLNIAIIAALLTSCGQKREGVEGSLSGEVRIDGSSTVYPITEAIAEEYRTEQPNVRVTVGVSGTGGGFGKFSRNEIAINNASRPIKDSEIEECEKNNVGFVSLSVAYDGLAVVVSKENDWVESLTVEELKRIWEPAAQGKLTHWNQIRPEWPNAPLNLYGPGIASGTYDYFTEAIVGKSGSSRGDYTASEDDNVLVQGVSGDKYALGFFGLAYFEENQEKLKLVGVDDGNGAILPSYESVKDGSYIPLSRPVFIYVNSHALQNEAVVDFVEFYLDIASELVQDVGYIALPEADYEVQRKKFQAFYEKSGEEI